MKSRAVSLLSVLVLVVSLPTSAAAQLSTPQPNVTAESESWYLSGAPINLGGILYYPSGPVTHFSANEMVFTGLFERVPVYKRTTQEPGSVLYVPLIGGLVRPYERRRSGELAGTVGSSAPSFPVTLPSAEANQSAAGPSFFGNPTPVIPRPVGTTGFLYGTAEPPPQPVGMAEATAPTPVGTGGSVVATPTLRQIGPARIETVRRPLGLNAVFIDYRDLRWYAAGPAVKFEAGRFTKTGEYRGFDVYEADGQTNTVYVSTIAESSTLVVPYTVR